MARLGNLAEAASAKESPLDSLSDREREASKLIVSGAGNTQIGRELSISRHTVKQHVTNIFAKLDVTTRVQAAVRAVRDGLL